MPASTLSRRSAALLGVDAATAAFVRRINFTRKLQKNQKIPQPRNDQSRDEAGDKFKVNGKYVDAAEKLKNEAPELAGY